MAAGSGDSMRVILQRLDTTVLALDQYNREQFQRIGERLDKLNGTVARHEREVADTAHRIDLVCRDAEADRRRIGCVESDIAELARSVEALASSMHVQITRLTIALVIVAITAGVASEILRPILSGILP
jgi:uncharacterized protein YoxC